jgi:hypothetical protein
VLKGKVADSNALATFSGDLNLQVDTGWLNRLGELLMSDVFNIVLIGILHQYIYIQCFLTQKNKVEIFVCVCFAFVHQCVHVHVATLKF